MVTPINMPRLGVTMENGTITGWLKNEGDAVQKGEPLFELETEKVTTVAEASDSGVLRKILASPGTVVPVGGVIALLTAPGEEFTGDLVRPAEPTVMEERAAPVQLEKQEQMPDITTRATPRARRLAREYQIDISKVEGTGPRGRIVEEDILRKVQAVSPERMAGPPVVAELKEMSPSRKAISERLSKSHLATVQVTITTSVDMTEMAEWRERAGSDERTGSQPSHTDMIVKVVSGVLREFPLLNSSLEGDKIKLFRDINIGVAVSVEDSLIVPVVHNADHKSLAEITSCLGAKIEKARRNEISVKEVSGGTFTISNLGIFDVEVFTPIINPPQCALLGVGKILRKPWVAGDQVTIRPVAILSLSFDHRIVDGALAARFLQTVKENMENPRTHLS